ncbi:MAG: hypothetical protein DHS80DRAFT_28705 [Piptocephalis tieghemiana]|nr:MAG: hypothetical protein DHS80DRAFT_28705 [Piptocephalis tieghemiana]
MSAHSVVLGYLSDYLVKPLQTTTISPFLPFQLLVTLHAMRIAFEFRRARLAARKSEPLPWLHGLGTCMVMAMGGSSIASLVLGIPPPWILSNTTVPTYALVYSLLHHSPSDTPYMLMETLSPILDPILIIADGCARALAQASAGADTARLIAPGSHIASLLCTTIAGCGGGIIADMLDLRSNQWTFRVPSHFQSPSLDLRASAAVGLLYTLTTDPSLYQPLYHWFYPPVGDPDKLDPTLPLLSPDESRALGCLITAGTLLYKRYGTAPLITSTAHPAKSKGRAKRSKEE